MKVWEYPLVTQITQIFPHAKVSGEIRARLDRKVARRQEMLEACGRQTLRYGITRTPAMLTT